MNNLDIRAKNLLATGYEDLCSTCEHCRRKIFDAGRVMFFICLKFDRKRNPAKIKCKKYKRKRDED